MSDTYNPNEIVKLKHLYGLADQIAQGFNGVQRQPRPLTKFQYLSGNTWTNVDLSTGVINMTTDQVYVNTNRNALCWQFSIPIQDDMEVPQIEITEQYTSPVYLDTITFTSLDSSLSLRGKWWIQIFTRNGEGVPAVAGSFKFKFKFNQSKQYDVVEKIITVNVTEQEP